MAFYLALSVAASALLALGLLMMKSRAAELPLAHGAQIPAAILAWCRDPIWIGGLGFDARAMRSRWSRWPALRFRWLQS